MIINDKTKKWLVSSTVSFITGFLIVVTPMLDSLTPENIGWATLSGIVFAGFRGGIKYLAEFIISLKK